jgi:predicted GNAT family acetyltransferase
METTVVDVPDRGRFEVRLGDRVVGLASYHVENGTMALPHTEVDPSVGGRGFGTVLVAGVLAAARERGLHVLLLRPPLHPAPSRGHGPRRRGGPPPLRAGDRRPVSRAVA